MGKLVLAVATIFLVYWMFIGLPESQNRSGLNPVGNARLSIR